jgi:serine/threonine-protein kinase PRP4
MLIVSLCIINCLVKPDNILLSRDSKTVKLCDFGSALYLEQIGVTEYIASRYYRAPEIILGCEFGTQIDMWSLGATLFEIYTGKILFPGLTNNDMLRLMIKMKGKVSNWMVSKGKFSSRHFTEQGIFISAKEEAANKSV